jgi:hypothetical protein
VVRLVGELADGKEEELAVGKLDGTAVLPWWMFLFDFVRGEEALPVCSCGFCVVGCHFLLPSRNMASGKFTTTSKGQEFQ